MVSYRSPYNLHLLFCCVLSILALIWLVLIALFSAAIKRDFASLLRLPFLIHVHIFSCEMLLISHLKCPLSYFSSHFSLLVLVSSVLFLVAVISLPPRFFVVFNRCVDASTLSPILIIIIIIVIISLCEFFTQALTNGFSQEPKWQQVYPDAVVWMVSIRTPISNSSSSFTKPRGTVPSTPITIGITATLILHSFSFPTRSKNLSFFSFSISTLSARTTKSTIR